MQFLAPADLFDYASPMKNSPGPLFTVRIPQRQEMGEIRNAIILENVQDPGNVGTVIRTAVADINVYKRDTKGVRVMRTEGESRIIAIEKVEKSEEEPIDEETAEENEAPTE